MKERARWGLLLSLGGVLQPACATARPERPPPTASSRLLGQTLPGFSRPTVQGPTFDTAATHDRVVVVDFFAAYCRPCQKSLPVLQRLVRENRGVTVVGVSLDDDPAAARLQIVRHGLTFPVIHDRARSLAGRFRVVDIPASFVVDRGGRIAWVAGPQHAAEAVAQAVASMGKDGPEEQQ